MVASFTCPDCRRTSYHPQDVANQYCGACHVFHQWGGIPSVSMTAKPKAIEPEPLHVEQEYEEVLMRILPRTVTDIAPGVSIFLHRDHPTDVGVRWLKSSEIV